MIIEDGKGSGKKAQVNDENELVATAKLSKPLLKTFAREATIRVKLDY